jgi:hypothetical protein
VTFSLRRRANGQRSPGNAFDAKATIDNRSRNASRTWKGAWPDARIGSCCRDGPGLPNVLAPPRLEIEKLFQRRAYIAELIGLHGKAWALLPRPGSHARRQIDDVQIPSPGSEGKFMVFLGVTATRR